MKIAMIPARMGSKRLPKKNLREIDGVPIIALAARKCIQAGIFDEIWINSEHPDFGSIAKSEGVKFHQRPQELGSDSATSEQFVHEFLTKHKCDHLIQVHSIAPLLTAEQVKGFTSYFAESEYDVLLSIVPEQIECAMNNNPVNFNFNTKINSQELDPIQRITWSITGWKADTYLDAFNKNKCATYSGKVGFYPIDRLAGHIIKREEDLMIAQALYPLRISDKI
jgi:CMP-N-acetylneuraminic acid synthetase